MSSRAYVIITSWTISDRPMLLTKSRCLSRWCVHARCVLQVSSGDVLSHQIAVSCRQSRSVVILNEITYILQRNSSCLSACTWCMTFDNVNFKAISSSVQDNYNVYVIYLSSFTSLVLSLSKEYRGKNKIHSSFTTRL